LQRSIRSVWGCDDYIRVVIVITAVIPGIIKTNAIIDPTADTAAAFIGAFTTAPEIQQKQTQGEKKEFA
jgi:phosphoribosyl-dephospho-CoA transferase